MEHILMMSHVFNRPESCKCIKFNSHLNQKLLKSMHHLPHVKSISLNEHLHILIVYVLFNPTNLHSSVLETNHPQIFSCQ